MKLSERIDPTFIFKDGLNFDDYYYHYKECFGNSDYDKKCCTCKYFKKSLVHLNNRLSTQFVCGNTAYVGDPVVSPTGPTYCYGKNIKLRWELHKNLDIEYHFHKHADINLAKDDDLYEVYEYNTGKMKTKTRKVPDRFLFLEYECEEEYEVPDIVYYIVKNKTYYLCSSRFYEDYYENTSFIPLTDFRRLLNTKYLVTLTDFEKAYKVIERLDYQKATSGTLVYTTGDTLEDKYKILESNKS